MRLSRVSRARAVCLLLLLAVAPVAATAAQTGPVTAIRAGRLVDPEAGTVATNQVILVQGNRFTAIGANVTIIGGVTIGDGAVVGAGAVVIRDIPPHSLAVGVPARVIRPLREAVESGSAKGDLQHEQCGDHRASRPRVEAQWP